MKKFFFVSVIASLALVTGCSSDGGDYTVESVDTVSFEMAGTGPVALDCAEGWECTVDYGGTMTDPVSYASVMPQELLLSVDNQIESMMEMYSADVAEAYELDGNQVAVLKGGESGDRMYWLYFTDLDGKDDYTMMCQGFVSEANYTDAVKADFEATCQSMRVES